MKIRVMIGPDSRTPRFHAVIGMSNGTGESIQSDAYLTVLHLRVSHERENGGLSTAAVIVPRDRLIERMCGEASAWSLDV